MIKLKDILNEIQNEMSFEIGSIDITSNSNQESPEYTIKLDQSAYDNIMLALDVSSGQLPNNKSLENIYKAFQNSSLK